LIKFNTKKDQSFYDLMDAQALAASQAASEFHKLSLDFSLMKPCLKRLDEIEHEADSLSHSLINKINTQFITPLDKEDLHALTDRLDDITDTIEKAASRIEVYRLREPRPDLPALVAQLKGITDEMKTLIGLLRLGFDQARLAPVIAGIHETESRMDKVFRKALTTLFEDETLDTRQLIKWKEIYEIIEKATNRTEHLASFVESLMVKYA
jgi:predicted phosphate transport protein (TIGR00153 family)